MPPSTHVRTDTVPLDQLQPFPGNARRGDVELILSSLKRNGQYRGLVARHVQPDGPLVVLAGNHTLQALQLHGAGACDYRATHQGEERPCGVCQGEDWTPAARVEVIVCDDDTARRINLVDNRANDVGDYDRDALAELLSYLDDDGFEGTGYTEAEVRQIAHAVPPLEEGEEEFPQFGEDIPTEYQCPKCSYTWSGKPAPGAGE
ncbi:ParB N-terminal domain-containing protein [Streptomyces fuscigenes]|uniref:ParB N-terminal domain-containing protein n=1 Tax=Streptomyces fuscigenes TaxID=1528880 RepID=UPI001F2627AF|nr:ParB N-terminal domain-containing protein [Streptomyces fuscigenes]MCF3960282.1 ParB/RepB/Spo0J family partition protein [Streptomyces fuscigenes]